MPRELTTIGDLGSMMGPTTRQRMRRAGYLRTVAMGIGQTNPHFAPGADSNNAGGDLQDAGIALLNYLDAHGVPSEHVSDPNVEAFQTAWNADAANASAAAKLSVDGGYGPNVHDALQALVGAIAPAVNTGAGPVPNVPGGTTPATPTAPTKPVATQTSGMSGMALFLILAAAAGAGYLLFGRKKRSASVAIHRNPRGGARRRRRML